MHNSKSIVRVSFRLIIERTTSAEQKNKYRHNNLTLVYLKLPDKVFYISII